MTKAFSTQSYQEINFFLFRQLLASPPYHGNPRFLTFSQKNRYTDKVLSIDLQYLKTEPKNLCSNARYLHLHKITFFRCFAYFRSTNHLNCDVIKTMAAILNFCFLHFVPHTTGYTSTKFEVI